MDTNTVEEICLNQDFSVYRYIPLNCMQGTIAVCFDEIDGGFNRKGFGVDFLLKQNIETFFVSHKRRSYFQGLSGEALAGCLKPYLSNNRIFTLGTSLGGYAALYYSHYLNAQAIAFSPRCSADPLLEKDCGVDFIHEPMNTLPKGLKKPVIVIDDKEEEDLCFYNERINKRYGDYTYTIFMTHATHWIPLNLSSLDKLKFFIISILENDKPPQIEFNYLESSMSLSWLAYDCTNKKSYDDSNHYLKLIDEMNGSKFLSDLRLRAYKKLIEQRSLTHQVNRDSITLKERKAVMNKHYALVKDAREMHQISWHQIDMYALLLDYQTAFSIAKNLVLTYPNHRKFLDRFDELKNIMEYVQDKII